MCKHNAMYGIYNTVHAVYCGAVACKRCVLYTVHGIAYRVGEWEWGRRSDEGSRGSCQKRQEGKIAGAGPAKWPWQWGRCSEAREIAALALSPYGTYQQYSIRTR